MQRHFSSEYKGMSMKKSLIKEGATSLTALVFLVIGATGVLMFFHLFDNYTKEMHEILGLLFVAAALLHLYFNWSAMQRYFPKKTFLLFAALTLITIAGFIATASDAPDPKRTIIDAVLKAPLETSAKLFDTDRNQIEKLLEKRGITLENSNSLLEIAQKNRKSPFEIIAGITKR